MTSTLEHQSLIPIRWCGESLVGNYQLQDQIWIAGYGQLGQEVDNVLLVRQIPLSDPAS